jgi:hypothetical protein
MVNIGLSPNAESTCYLGFDGSPSFFLLKDFANNEKLTSKRCPRQRSLAVTTRPRKNTRANRRLVVGKNLHDEAPNRAIA